MHALRAFLLTALIAVPAIAGTEPPYSEYGQVDCGKHHNEAPDVECITRPCSTNDQCASMLKAEAEPLPPYAPGGLAYGCMSDVHMCGFMHPTDYEKSTKQLKEDSHD